MVLDRVYGLLLWFWNCSRADVMGLANDGDTRLDDDDVWPLLYKNSLIGADDDVDEYVVWW